MSSQLPLSGCNFGDWNACNYGNAILVITKFLKESALCDLMVNKAKRKNSHYVQPYLAQCQFCHFRLRNRAFLSLDHCNQPCVGW